MIRRFGDDLGRVRIHDMKLIRQYRRIFSAPGVAAVAGAGLLGALPLSMSLALLLLLREATMSYAVAGVALGAYSAAAAVAAPIKGRLVDRRGQRPVLIVSGLSFGGTLALMAAVADAAPDEALIALAVMAGAVNPPV